MPAGWGYTVLAIVDLVRGAAFVAVVDDDESTRTAIHGVLQAAGFRSQPFASAQAFLASPSLADCACLVVDLQMPGISGLELQERLLDMSAGIPIVFVSAYGDERSRARAMQRGALGFLDKPFDDTALLALVSKPFEKSTEAP